MVSEPGYSKGLVLIRYLKISSLFDIFFENSKKTTFFGQKLYLDAFRSNMHRPKSPVLF